MQCEAGVDCLGLGRLAGLVIDNRQATIGKPVNAVGAAVEDDPAKLGLAACFGGDWHATVGAVGAFLVGNPFDRFEQARLPQRAEHRVDRISLNQCSGATDQIVGVALRILEPILENFVDRTALPRRAVIGIDRVEPVEAEHGARIESEWIGLQPVDLGHGNLARAVGGGWAGLRAAGGEMLARVVDHRDEAFELVIAREAAGHRHQPKP